MGGLELIKAFKEDGKILIGYTSPTDHKTILGIILLVFLDSLFSAILSTITIASIITVHQEGIYMIIK